MKLLEWLFGPKTDYKELLRHGAVIIDVRTQPEFDSGHIKGAMNIPVDTINSRIEYIKALNKVVITVCLSGSRSNLAKARLAAAGIEVYSGGGWKALANVIA